MMDDPSPNVEDLVRREGIEPPTARSSGEDSTN